LAFVASVGFIAISWFAAGPAEATGTFGTPKPNVGCGNDLQGQPICRSIVHFLLNGSTETTTTNGTSDASPAPCWYEPSTLFSATLLRDAYMLPLVNLLVLALTGGDTGKDFDFHAGQKGYWWEFVYNPAMPLPDAQAQCQLSGPILEWVADTNTAPQNAVTTWKMAAAAAKIVPISLPKLTLRPGADKQVVNLPTLVSFTDPLPRTWVTAQLNVNGFALAATTVATPASITVNAGSPDASPSSCTYSLALSGGGYQVDPSSTRCSDGSSGPNAGIVYRRPTPAGVTYPVTAAVTWNVAWTDTASPDSPPQTYSTLNPLTLTTPPMPVTVNEIESVN
jgi:enoyl reductase